MQKQESDDNESTLPHVEHSTTSILLDTEEDEIIPEQDEVANIMIHLT